MEFKNPDRNQFEYFVVVIIIAVVAMLVGANIYYQRQAAKQKSLYYELQVIRSGINLFKVVEKRSPKNLTELARGTYKFDSDKDTKKFLYNVPFDKSGNLVDPFGNVFMYDYNTGWIRSSTKGYEMW